MAILSNINDKFAVDSTGAIKFNGQVGTSGYILKSNGNTAPTWVDPDTVIGGPYLPLTGGTLTGNLAINGTNSLSVGGAGTFAGSVTANSFIKSGGTSSQYLMADGSVSTSAGVTGTGVNNRLAIWNGTTAIDSDSDFYVDGDTIFTANFQASGNIGITGTSFLDGDVTIGDTNSAFIGMARAGANYIAATNASGELIFRTAGSTPALTLDTNQNATFASAVWIPDYIYHVGDANTKFGFGGNDSFQIDTSGTTALSIDTSQNATFAGYVETHQVRTDVINNKANSANIIYRSGTSTLVGGGTTANKLYVLDNGNIGIGTTSPAEKLEVSGGHIKIINSGNTNLYINANNSGSDSTIFFQETNSTKAKIQHDASNDSMLFTDGAYTDTMTLKGGKVGIGTTSPENKLHILRSSSDTQSQLMVQNGSTGDAAIKFNVSGQSYVMGIDYDDSKKFKIASSSNLGTTDRITLLSSGNVGIGTISPTSRLHVNGSGATHGEYFRISNGTTQIYELQPSIYNVTNNGFGIYDVTDSTYRLVIDTSGQVAIGTTSPTSPAGVAKFLEIQGSTAGIVLHDDGNDPYEIWASGGNLVFRYNNTDGANGMLLSSTGNLGIGTTSPEAKLDISNVAGATYALEISTPERNRALFYYNSASTSDAGYLGIKRGSVDALNHRFATTGNSAVCIGEGNFGIGTDSAGTKLDVRGTGNFLGTAVSGAALVTIENNSGSTATSYGLLVKGGGNSSSGKTFEVRDDSGNTDLIVKGNGNVGIGTTSPIQKLDTPNIIIGGSTIAGTYRANALFMDNNGGNSRFYSSGPNGTTQGSYEFNIMASDANPLQTVLVINNSGNVGIGNTSPQTTLHTGPTTTVTNVFTARFAASNFFASGGNSMFYVPDTAANIMMFGSNQLGTNQIEFYHKNPGTSQAYVGRISTSSSATSYVTSSDYRLKENIVPISDSISRLNQLKPSRFNFIEEPGKIVDGFIAHEVQDIVPEAIVGEKDEVDEDGGIIPQGIDQAKLVPLLVAAMQELEARVKELENK